MGTGQAGLSSKYDDYWKEAGYWKEWFRDTCGTEDLKK